MCVTSHNTSDSLCWYLPVRTPACMIALTCKNPHLHDSPLAELGLEIGTRTARVVFVTVTDTLPRQYPETSWAKHMAVDQGICESDNSHCGMAVQYKREGIMSKNKEYTSLWWYLTTSDNMWCKVSYLSAAMVLYSVEHLILSGLEIETRNFAI